MGAGMTPSSEYSEHSRRLITERCLVAADIDQTLLFSGADRERQHFLENLAPELLRAASMGVSLAFLTANSMHELSSRFLRWLIDQLVHTDRLYLLDRFHFFVNAAGVYVHFSLSDKALSPLFSKAHSRVNPDKVLRALTTIDSEQKLVIRPRFVNTEYVDRCRIPDADAAAIVTIMDEVAQKYLLDLQVKKSSYEGVYDISKVSEASGFRVPKVDWRVLAYGAGPSERKASVQLTLKPILSFRHAYKPSQVYGKDLRAQVIDQIQEMLDRKGLGHYVARPGGLSSVDVALEKVDKAYALEFLIDTLNLRGYARLGQKTGSNAIYIGDEVIVGGGNDYPITRIPGLLVFAVNPDQQLIPFLSHVFVPSAILVGPDATAQVLAHFNKCVVRLLKEPGHLAANARVKTALEVLKEEIFVERIREIISHLGETGGASVEDWQTIHTLVTLMQRNDPAARQWLAILIRELDEIMIQLAGVQGTANAALVTPVLPE
jgi:hydroxymethylpyrimidine pyrophosphatase-like HAD family hydrolase